MNFASDNWAGASDPVSRALAAAAAGLAPAYGGDELTRRVGDRFNQVFEREVSVAFVATGSAANGLALSCLMKPGGVVICHRDSHIFTDECGAPGFLADGAKLLTLGGRHGKLVADDVGDALRAHGPGNSRAGRAVAVSITQLSEAGTAYSVEEISAIGERARRAGVGLHMDGARFANALAALGCSPADMTWRAGVDVLSFGATKNGCWCAEAVVFFDPERGDGFDFVRARSGHRFSKNRFVAAQFEGYFAQDHWLELARHANRRGAELAEGLSRSPHVRLAWPSAANEVFAVMGQATAEHLRQAGAVFHPWPAGAGEVEPPLAADEAVYRLVTSFCTRPEAVTALLAALAAK